MLRVKNAKIKKILSFYKEISLLGKTNALLGWDLNVNLPPKGAEDRAQQSAYITKLITEKWLDKSFRILIEDSSKNQNGLTEEEKAILKNLKYICSLS